MDRIEEKEVQIEKLPAPKELTEQMYNHCTCDLFNWPEEICPFIQEINEREVECNCCPYHYRQCQDDI